MLGSYAATVCAIVHDEMFFLPAFLAHYRRLGADRFVILDDASTDGTADVPRGPARRDGGRQRHPLLRRGLLSAGDARPHPRDPGGPPVARPDARPVLHRPVGGGGRSRRVPRAADEPADVLRGARRRGRRGGLGGDGRHVPGTGAATSSAGTPPRASASRTLGSSTPGPTSTRVSRARPRRCRAPSIRGACRGSSPPGTSCRRARSPGGSAAGSPATATRRRARSTRRRSSSGARATGS